jgi:hypothetical protein
MTDLYIFDVSFTVFPLCTSNGAGWISLLRNAQITMPATPKGCADLKPKDLGVNVGNKRGANRQCIVGASTPAAPEALKPWSRIVAASAAPMTRPKLLAVVKNPLASPSLY